MRLISFLFGVFAILVLWVFIPYGFIWFNQLFGLSVINLGLLKPFGVLLVFLGVGLALAASLTFKLHGKGTPMLTEPPKQLVAKGLYKYTRNPIYVAHILIYLGLFILLGYLTLLVLFVIGIIVAHLYLVNVEEPALVKRYGQEYRKYMTRVPRWLLI